MRPLDERAYEADSDEYGPWMGIVQMRGELPADAISDSRGPVARSVEEARHDPILLMQWAFRYGVAYAALRYDDPLIGEKRAQEEAQAAATQATRWHTSVGGMPE
jgi:hypothetical protein